MVGVCRRCSLSAGGSCAGRGRGWPGCMRCSLGGGAIGLGCMRSIDSFCLGGKLCLLESLLSCSVFSDCMVVPAAVLPLVFWISSLTCDFALVMAGCRVTVTPPALTHATLLTHARFLTCSLCPCPCPRCWCLGCRARWWLAGMRRGQGCTMWTAMGSAPRAKCFQWGPAGACLEACERGSVCSSASGLTLDPLTRGPAMSMLSCKGCSVRGLHAACVETVALPHVQLDVVTQFALYCAVPTHDRLVPQVTRRRTVLLLCTAAACTHMVCWTRDTTGT